MNELRRAALAALRIAEPGERCRAVNALADFGGEVDTTAALSEPPGIPGRPARPLQVPPAAVAPRSVGTNEGRAALLHALAHIEFNAIGLALDHLWRFAGMPEGYYRDWLGVAVEEARHFALLRGRLNDAGFDYGDFPAHDGLWEMARRTDADVLARMALVPRTLEARGLDASPAVRAKFLAVGDQESARVIDVILRDEIGHVAIGNRWFRHLCAQRGVDPLACHRQAVIQYGAPRPQGKMNVAARLQAGFTAEELRDLKAC
jgi:uncharacterized ferritin-like protein (DUF455 family)